MFFEKKSSTQPRIYRTIALSFFGVSLIVALVVFYVSFSWATIRITPSITPIQGTARIMIQELPTPSAGTVYGKVIQKELEGEGAFTPSTSETKQARVSGVITVVNKTNKAQPLRATTRFLSPNNILFRSTESVVVPAGLQVDVSVAADKDGDLGELDTSRFTIPGLWEPLQKNIYGASFSQKHGGVAEIRKVTPDDITRAEQEVQKKLEEKFSLQLDAEKPSLSVLSAGTVYRSDIVERTASAAVGYQTDDFSVRLKVRFTAALYDEQQFIARLQERVQQNVTSGYELLPIRPGQYSGVLSAFDPTAKTATADVQVEAQRVRSDDIQPYHTRDLAGLTKDAIIEYFRGYDDIIDVSVSFYPFWVTRAPLLTDHIKIVVEKK